MLTVNVRVERLQEISEEDAKAEGVERGGGRLMTDHPALTSHRATFIETWDSINAKRMPIREILDGEDLARLDRAHFASFGDFALNFVVVYWMLYEM